MTLAKGLFVTGTDTGVGKTVIAGALAAALKKEGYDVGVMKPAQSGAARRGKELYSEDAEFLVDMARSGDPQELYNPYLLKKPLSPYHAAKAEGIEIDVDSIAESYRELTEKHDIVIVEGAGGLFAPLTEELYMGDLARVLGLPLLVVAHPYLGGLNHTLLTCNGAGRFGLEVTGIVFNQWKKRRYPEPDFEFIERAAGAPVFGLVPYIEKMDRAGIAAGFWDGVDVEKLISALRTAPRRAAARHKSYEERDKKFVWHPFTQMKDWMAEPLTVIESGRGVTLKDVKGREYLDGHSSYWCNVHGHCDAELNNAVKKQLDKVAHSTFLGMSNAPAVDLAEKLVEITPEGLDRVFYSDDGSTAVEVALKMSYQYWKHVEPDGNRDRFLAVNSAYHGDTIGAVSVGGIDQYHATFKKLLFRTDFVEAPYCYRCPLGKTYPDCAIACVELVDEALSAHKGRYAAMIIEPLVQCPAGIITAPHGYLRRAREICARHGVLFIADEVAVGFGRTGRMFACEHEEVSPDIMTLSKSISGGLLPFAATLSSEKVFDAFMGDYEEMKTFFHGHTFTANQVGAAASLESVRLMEERRMVENIQLKAADLADSLVRYNDLAHVGDIRQRGLIVGVELVEDKETKKPYDWSERMGVRCAAEAKKRGLLVRPLGNVMVLFPAPAASTAQMAQMADILYESIAAVTGE